MNKSTWSVVAFIFLAAAVFSQEVIHLYQGNAPGSEEWALQEREMTFPGTTFVLVQNVTSPSLRLYAPPKEKVNGTAIIVAPGGGFETIVESVEGTPVAKELNARGITVFLLRYRIFQTNDDFLNSPDRSSGLEPDIDKRMLMFNQELRAMVLADAKLAVEYVRRHAQEFDIDPNRIGFMGFSAGGTVASLLATGYDAGSRPDFVAPVYGWIFEDLTIPENGPPVFLVHAGDDTTVPVSSSIHFYNAWKKGGNSAEMHLYAHGGHGFGVMKKNLPVGSWMDRFYDWLLNESLVKPL
jgi:acetyl esterase/lipase